MKKKIIILFVVLLFSLSLVWAENNTTENMEIKEDGNYIHPVSVINDVIKFDDGFEGFCIDLTKNDITTDDKFEPGQFASSDTENNVKLAIIEAYKQGREDDLGNIINKILKSDLDDSDDVIKEVINSNEKIKDQEVVDIDNTTEATFTFELLKSADDEKSDCIAYKVLLKTVEKEDTLGTSENRDVKLENESDNTNDTAKTPSKKDNAGDSVKSNSVENNTNDSVKTTSTDDNKKQPENEVNETNKTITNKTNTVITIENNTTIIHKNNVKELNNTTPQKQNTFDIMKTAGNPIFILIVVVVIAVAAAVIMKRKD